VRNQPPWAGEQAAWREEPAPMGRGTGFLA